MRQWILNNYGNCLVLTVLVLLCVAAIRSLWLDKKSGKCAGCSVSSCSSCSGGRNIVAEARKAYNEDKKKAQSLQ